MILLQQNSENNQVETAHIRNRGRLLKPGTASIETSLQAGNRAKVNQDGGECSQRQASSSTVAASPYMRDLGRSQLLDRDTEIALFERLSDLRCTLDRLEQMHHETTAEQIVHVKRQLTGVRNTIALANLRLVASIAAKFARAESPEFHEMVSKGHETLLRTIDLFDVTQGTKFSTYATTAIRRTCWQHCRSEYQHRDRFLGGDQQAMAAVTDESAPLTAWIEVPENAHGLKGMLDELPDRQRRIIVARFGLDGSRPSTLQGIADQMNLSKERVRQLLIQAVESLRKSAIRYQIDPPETL